MRRNGFLSLVALCLVLVAAFGAEAQTSPDGIWSEISIDTLKDRQGVNSETPHRVNPTRFRAFALNKQALEDVLQAAPLERLDLKPTDRPIPVTINLPTPDGEYVAFEFVESPVMEPGLAARFPGMRTYVGKGIGDPSKRVRFDRTPAGFHAQVLSQGNTWYIDPYDGGETYVSFYKRDYPLADKAFECLTEAAGDQPDIAVAARSGDTLREYRLAVACTGEYTQFHGGTVEGALAAIVTTINRVTGIYEQELAIRLILVENNDAIIYTDGSADPFSNDDGYAMLSQSQAVIDAVIGTGNYDVGHTFSTGGGGIAYLRAVCSSTGKARGVTGSSWPTGDPFDVDYVAHELGHQFGANHTFDGRSGSCAGSNRTRATAYEPGSGSTIMAYAGICYEDDLQAHSDPIFHSISHEEVVDFVSGVSCGTEIPLENAIPVVDAGSDYTIPKNTPFTLTGSGTDSDPNDALTYLWEEHDLSGDLTGAYLDAKDNGKIPLFRVFTPVDEGKRHLPRLDTLAAGVPDDAEKLPQVARDMSFRLTVRDGNGGVASDDIRIAVKSGAGPFRVTFPNETTDAAPSGGTMTVTWDVANTDAKPVSSSLVDISLSLDGGLTWDEGSLASSTPNDGSEVVAVPDIATDQARVMVSAEDNIFFDISDQDFSIRTDCVNEGPYLDPTCSDGEDNDCDSLTDAEDDGCMPACADNDADGYGNPGNASCEHPEADCDDTDPNIHPGARERYFDGKDDNCNGTLLCGAMALDGNVTARSIAGNMVVLLLPGAALALLRRRYL